MKSQHEIPPNDSTDISASKQVEFEIPTTKEQHGDIIARLEDIGTGDVRETYVEEQ